MESRIGGYLEQPPKILRGKITDVDATPRYEVGTIYRTLDCREFVYGRAITGGGIPIASGVQINADAMTLVNIEPQIKDKKTVVIPTTDKNFAGGFFICGMQMFKIRKQESPTVIKLYDEVPSDLVGKAGLLAELIVNVYMYFEQDLNVEDGLSFVSMNTIPALNYGWFQMYGTAALGNKIIHLPVKAVA